MKDELLLLDDGKQYLVVEEIVYQENKYLYLIEKTLEKSNTMFCKMQDDNLTLVEDSNLLTILMEMVVASNLDNE